MLAIAGPGFVVVAGKVRLQVGGRAGNAQGRRELAAAVRKDGSLKPLMEAALEAYR